MGGKDDLAIGLSIFFVAFIFGAVFAVGFTTGVPTDEGGISTLIVEKVCEVAEESDNNSSKYNCGLFITIMILVSIIAAIAAIAIEAAKMDNWIVGLVIYAIGWVSGLIFMLSTM